MHDRIGIACEIAGKAKMLPDFFSWQLMSIHGNVLRTMFTQDMEFWLFKDQSNGSTHFANVAWSSDNSTGNDHPASYSRDDNPPKLFMIDGPGFRTDQDVNDAPVGTIYRARANFKSWVVICVEEPCPEPSGVLPISSNWMRVSDEIQWYTRVSGERGNDSYNDPRDWQLNQDIPGDNMQGLGETNVGWDLQ